MLSHTRGYSCKIEFKWRDSTGILVSEPIAVQDLGAFRVNIPSCLIMLQARLQISDQEQMSYSRSNIEHIRCIDTVNRFRLELQDRFIL